MSYWRLCCRRWLRHAESAAIVCAVWRGDCRRCCADCLSGAVTPDPYDCGQCLIGLVAIMLSQPSARSALVMVCVMGFNYRPAYHWMQRSVVYGQRQITTQYSARNMSCWRAVCRLRPRPTTLSIRFHAVSKRSIQRSYDMNSTKGISSNFIRPKRMPEYHHPLLRAGQDPREREAIHAGLDLLITSSGDSRIPAALRRTLPTMAGQFRQS